MSDKNRSLLTPALLALLVAGLLALPLAASAAQGTVAGVSIGSGSITFEPLVAYEKLVLTVSGEGYKPFELEFAADELATLRPVDGDGNLLADGTYNWQLWAMPALSLEVQERLAEARATGDDLIVQELRLAGKLPSQPLVQSGTFSVLGGAFVEAVAEEGGNKDQVIPDDLIVQGSLCVGVDCVNNENFGFDTIRMKENNTRVKFEDTSTGAFPSTDWQLTANDSASGGANKFSIEDITAARVPFTITGAAPTNSLFMTSAGRIGLGTSTPALQLQVTSGDSPGIRLEQNGSSGFTPQTWDIVGNEANFFVRDVTSGSRLIFRVQPGAPSNSLYIASSGNVGLGTTSPSPALHVTRSDRTSGILVEETNGTAADQDMLTLRNNGNVNFNLENTDAASVWQFRNTGAGGFTVTLQGSGGSSLRIAPNGAFSVGPGGVTNFQVAANGNATLVGTLTQGSDRNHKKDIVPVSGSDVLSRLAQVPISLWTYNWDDGVRHLGPMAQDFHAAFGLGDTDKGISTLDAAGVALAAVKELDGKDKQLEAVNQELTTEVGQLKERNAELEARLAALEALVQSLSR